MNVRPRFARYFTSGMPPASASARVRMRLPSSTSQMPWRSTSTQAGIMRASYW